MLDFLTRWLDPFPQRILALSALACLGMLGFAIYLQHIGGLTPCPMCVVQRYALTGVMLCAALGSTCSGRAWRTVWTLLALMVAGFGAFVAARQSWLQWYPPEAFSCGRDFYGIIENHPISRAIPLLFRGSGDCTAVDWTLLGGTIANWSFLCFSGFGLLFVTMLARGRGRKKPYLLPLHKIDS